MELKEFQNKDMSKVIQFAIDGMHLDLYLKNKLLLKLYGRYFWYLEANRATRLYDSVNKELLAKYKETNSPDGEIIFLAANPDVKVKGIGTMLLNELTNREKGKQIYLYTDNACTYQFYEHRGFDKVGEKDIELDLGANKLPMTCLLYSKVL